MLHKTLVGHLERRLALQGRWDDRAAWSGCPVVRPPHLAASGRGQSEELTLRQAPPPRAPESADVSRALRSALRTGPRRPRAHGLVANRHVKSLPGPVPRGPRCCDARRGCRSPPPTPADGLRASRGLGPAGGGRGRPRRWAEVQPSKWLRVRPGNTVSTPPEGPCHPDVFLFYKVFGLKMT